MAWFNSGGAAADTPRFLNARPRLRLNTWLTIAIVGLLLFIFSAWSSSSLDVSHMKDAIVDASKKIGGATQNYSAPSTGPLGDKVIVIARRESEDVSWVEEYLGDWQHAIYTVDNTSAPLHVNVNKGREANVYLEYLITHYHHLPEIMAFVHAHKAAWHVDALGWDQVYLLNKLKLDFVRRNGYANLRCHWTPGCPEEIQPFRDHTGMDDLENMGDKKYICEQQIRENWADIFGNNDVPKVIAAPCCAEFAVTREQVHQRPLEQYMHFQKWMLNSDINEGDLGRIFEYIWHIIFGQTPVYCPEEQACLVDVFGSSWFVPPPPSQEPQE